MSTQVRTAASKRPTSLSTSAFWRFMIGFFVFNTLIYAGFTMVTGILMPQKLKDLGIADYSSALGTISAVGAVLSMFINVFLGALSDRTRTRFGKRSPWIVVGALLTGLGFFIISLPATWVGVGIAYCVKSSGLPLRRSMPDQQLPSLRCLSNPS